MEMTMLPKCDGEYEKDSRQNRHERIRNAYIRSKLSYEQLSVLLGVKRDTLAKWLTKSAIRVPPEYVVEMIENRVNEYLSGGVEDAVQNIE